MRTITITGYRRPHLFRQMLESLVAGGLKGWRILIQIEPSERAEEFKTIAAELLAGENYSLRVNETVLGVRENPFNLVERAFAEGADTLLYLEEDLLLAPDVTALAEWYAENHRAQWLCLCLLNGSCQGGGFISSPTHNDLLIQNKSFNAWGFVCRRQEWETHFRKVWAKNVGWDWAVYFRVLRTKGLFVLHPIAARSTNTGRDEGTYANPEIHDRQYSRVELALEGPANRQYKVVTQDELPPALALHAALWDELNDCLLKNSRATWENWGLTGRVEALTKENEQLKQELEKRNAPFWKRILSSLRKKPAGNEEA